MGKKTSNKDARQDLQNMFQFPAPWRTGDYRNKLRTVSGMVGSLKFQPPIFIHSEGPYN